jgi:hypothetical protein
MADNEPPGPEWGGTGRESNPFDALLDSSYSLEDDARRIQGESDPGAQELRAVEHAYLQWLARCSLTLPEGLRKPFVEQYEGGTWTPRVKAYLQAPRDISPFWSEGASSKLLSRWAHPFDVQFRPPILAQRQLLQLAQEQFERSRASAAVYLIERMARHFGEYARQLEKRQRGAEGFLITDEYGMQDAFHAALRLHFEDVRPEEWTPSYAGGASRMDFLVSDGEVAVELKYIHENQTSRAIGSEVAEDILRYQAHESCHALVVLVWDRGHVLANYRGLERDLSREHGSLSTLFVVVH